MIEIQFLILLAVLIPLFSCILAVFGNSETRLYNFFSKVFPLIFFTCLVILNKKLITHNPLELSLGSSIDNIILLLRLDRLSLAVMFVLSFLWLIFVVYSNQVLKTYANNNGDGIKLFFGLTIFFLILLISAGNLVTVFFSLSFLAILKYFFVRSSSKSAQSRLSQALNLSLYCEIIFLFFAVIATQKSLGTTDFSKMESFAAVDGSKQAGLLALYFTALFLPIIFGCFFLYRDAFLQPIYTYSILFFQALASFYVVLRLCFSVFDGGVVFDVDVEGFWHVFEIIILANSLLMLLLILMSHSLKTMFFYLFFQQFTFAVFALLMFAIFDQSKIHLVLLSFALLLTLMFLCISNLIIFLSKAENKSLKSALRLMRVTFLLFIFASASLCGLSPSIAMVENFFLAKIILQQRMPLSAVIFLVNSLTVLVLFWKVILPVFRSKKSEEGKIEVQSDVELAKEIDLDSALILGAVFVAIAMMLCPIFLSPIATFLNQN